MLELLSPAGSMESVTAAVQNGADAVYLGYGDFNARRNAKNFTREELASAVSYCHLRGCKVHLTLNTLLTDRELKAAAELAADVSCLGVDAVIVQDLGVVRMLRQAAPDLSIHGSTQMTIHSLDGVKVCAELGMDRVVLSRELSRDAIASICAHSPIEIETFVHGAMCMCYSGQCYFSGVIGGRSGNRGLCAQPCRLNYGWNGKANEYPLSLKDMSLAGHLKELNDMGVACLKIEGRMKRPEYVAIVTRVYARALKERRDPTAQEMEQLRQAFSREGFSDGYFMDKKGKAMFGTRQEEEFPRELFAQARATFEKGENRKESIWISANVQRGQPIQVTIQDKEGHTAVAEGAVPEPAVNVPLTPEKVEGQLSRTGGTPFLCEQVTAHVEPGLSLPLSSLNALRRQALEELRAQRTALPQRRTGTFQPIPHDKNVKEPPVFTIGVHRAEQLTEGLLKQSPALVYLPVEELAAHPEKAALAREAGVPLAVRLPRICWDRELNDLDRCLDTAKELGVTQVLAGTLGMVYHAADLGFSVRGDFGLGLYNSETMEELKGLGLVSATASFELKLPQIRDLSKNMNVELIGYGRLPLMITENCIIHNHTGKHTCGGVNLLTDRKGEQFQVVKAWGCRNEILNAKTLWLADKLPDLEHLGLWGVRLEFTTETPEQCMHIVERYLGQGDYQPTDYTRGLYYRGVE